MFPLNNFRGSCWVNACLQSIYRIPDVQKRYSATEFTSENDIDKSLHKIWETQGKDGLKEFFETVRTATMPAGQGIGDSHELLQYLCDKLKYLDGLFRFKIADSIECKACKTKEMKEDTIIELSIVNDGRPQNLIGSIADMMKPTEIDGWKCEKCNEVGCVKQQLIGDFPKVLMFHKTSVSGRIEYPSVLEINKKQYALLSVTCFTGGHWFAFGRNSKNSSWHTLDDTRIVDHGPNKFPLAVTARLLIYYRLDE
jgi:uncharacterized UBP type Zn finger protein